MRVEQFAATLATGSCKVGVVGLGYVGLPLALEFTQRGCGVLGFDVDPVKIDRLRAGESYIRHIPNERLHSAVQRGLEATHDFSRLSQCDAILMCVPTPLTDHREPDLQFVTATADLIATHLRAGQLVVLESTTYPGTTREVVLPILERGGLRAGTDFYLAYSPEREDPSNPTFTPGNTPRLVGGYTPDCERVATALYARITTVVPVRSLEVAEASKILENTFRAVNIALVNELKIVFHRMGIDIWDVIDAASTKPFGFMRFTPGPGLGGHCIPIDPFYLSWKAREYDIACRFIETAGEVNASMPHYVCQRLLEVLSRHGRGVGGAKVLLIGLAYKKNVDDERESPSYKLMEILRGWGAIVDYHDPLIPEIRRTRKHPELAGQRSVSLQRVREYDAVVVSTDHDGIDWEFIQNNAQIAIDTRGVLARDAKNVFQA